MFSPCFAVEFYDAGSFQKYLAFAYGIGIVGRLPLAFVIFINGGMSIFREYDCEIGIGFRRVYVEYLVKRFLVFVYRISLVGIALCENF